MYVPFREGTSPRIHAAAQGPVCLESEEAHQRQLARLESQVTNLVAQERPTLAQREASGTRAPS